MRNTLKWQQVITTLFVPVLRVKRNFFFSWQLVLKLTSGGFMFSTFVIRPCIMRKWGLLTFNWTDRNKSCTLVLFALLPFIKYLFLPPITTWKNIFSIFLNYITIRVRFVWQPSDFPWSFGSWVDFLSHPTDVAQRPLLQAHQPEERIQHVHALYENNTQVYFGAFRK